MLIEHLAQAAGIAPGRRILDVGCGFGASSIYLARNYNAEATGIKISPVQVEMANKAASTENVKAKFLLMDAQAMNIDQSFDVIGRSNRSPTTKTGKAFSLPPQDY